MTPTLLDTRRIHHLLDGFDAVDTEITLVGLGSGGASPLQPIGIRPEKGVFTSHYQTKRLLVQAQHDCLLTCGGERA